MQNCLCVIFCPFSNMNTCRQFYHLNKLTQILQQDEIKKIYILRFLLKIINEKHFEVKHFSKSFFCCCSEKLNGAERAKGLIWNCETEPLWKGSMERCSIVFYLSTGNIMVGCMGAGSSYQMMFDATLTLKWALSRYIYIYWPPFHSTQILVLFKSDSTQNQPFYKNWDYKVIGWLRWLTGADVQVFLKNLLCLWSFPSDWLQGSLLSFYLECVSWRREGRVEKQGFSIFSYINFLSATTEEAFIANARPYKFVGQLKYPATQIDKNLSTRYFPKWSGQICFCLKP